MDYRIEKFDQLDMKICGGGNIQKREVQPLWVLWDPNCGLLGKCRKCLHSQKLVIYLMFIIHSQQTAVL